MDSAAVLLFLTVTAGTLLHGKLSKRVEAQSPGGVGEGGLSRLTGVVGREGRGAGRMCEERGGHLPSTTSMRHSQ
ncbi:hypothetical protein NQZ68_015918 [Dissostichus eleginoides]|nr:hypothetical protein NQZ68_015918 [Dissostichus eleginoides]